MADNETEQKENGEKVRPFIDTFRALEYGQLLEDLSVEQRTIIDAVLETNCKAELTIKLTYKKTGTGQMSIKAKVSKSLPQKIRDDNVFFINDELNLQRDHPKQMGLSLRDASKPEQQTVKEAK